MTKQEKLNLEIKNLHFKVYTVVSKQKNHPANTDQ